MGFSGGGSNILKAHTHNGLTVQDGGALDFDDITQSQSSAGMVFYSDGTHLQQLAYPGVPAGETLTAAAASTQPSWAAASAGAFTVEGSDIQTGYVANLSVDVTDKNFYQVFYNISSEGSTSCAASVRINSVNSGYDWQIHTQWDATVGQQFSTSDSQVILEAAQSNKTSCGVITIWKSDPNGRNAGTSFRGLAMNSLGNALNYQADSAGYLSSVSTAVTSIQILYNAGNVEGSMTVMSADF
jgi:hypothetical protein